MKHLKRITALSLIMALFLSLTACSAGGEGQDISSALTAVSDSGSIQSSASEPEVDPETDFEKTSVDGLYVIDGVTVPQGSYVSNIASNSRYLATEISRISDKDGTCDVTLNVFDLAEKKVVSDIDLNGDMCSVGFLPDGSICTGSTYNGTITIYDILGNTQKTFTDIDGAYEFCSDEKGRIWAFNGNELHCIDGDSEEVININVPGGYPNAVNAEGDKVIISFTSAFGGFCVYDASSGKLTQLPLVEGFGYSDGVFLKAEEGSFFCSTDGNEIISFDFEPSENGVNVASADGNIYIISDTEITRVDTASHKHSVTSLGEIFPFFPVSFAEGVIFDAADEDAEKIFYFAPSPADSDLDGFSSRKLSDSEKKNAEAAEEIYKTYGVVVHPLPLPGGMVFSSYAAEADATPEDCAAFIKRISECLSAYPDGFLRQFCNDTVRVLEFYGCNGLVGAGSESIARAGAITDSNGPAITITVDLSSIEYLEGTVAHELMHAVEKSLTAAYPEKNIYMGWNDLNPAGFSYAERYVDDSGNDITDYTYTWMGEMQSSNVWFFDAYSRTFSTEDRSRIFENMVAGIYDNLFDCPHLRAKADYLVDLLDEYFTLPEGTKPVWMKHLN